LTTLLSRDLDVLEIHDDSYTMGRNCQSLGQNRQASGIKGITITRAELLLLLLLLLLFKVSVLKQQ
jgi:hypothetical protein